jgi:hypothetical protein
MKPMFGLGFVLSLVLAGCAASPRGEAASAGSLAREPSGYRENPALFTRHADAEPSFREVASATTTSRAIVRPPVRAVTRGH